MREETVKAAAAAQTELGMWYHGAGNEVESNILTSTLLRMIAGLEDITSGTQEIDGTVVNEIEPSSAGSPWCFRPMPSSRT